MTRRFTSKRICTFFNVRGRWRNLMALPGPRLFGGLVMLLVFVILSDVSPAQDAKQKKQAASQYPVRLKLEPLSIRNRSNGASLVRMELKYNLPQILEGDLELTIYDGKYTEVAEDQIALMRISDIVLLGQDYTRNILLPPLRMGPTKTWSIVAWFEAKDGRRIPLSSSLSQVNPPAPHELLMTSPMDRGVLICSCIAERSTNRGSETRQFLESMLSLDNYNPVTHSQVGVPRESLDAGSERVEYMGKQVVVHAQSLPARDLPEDPLSFCAFDLVLLSDGGLAALTPSQMDGMSKWIAAGGSLCVYPDTPMKPVHMEFLNSLLTEDNPQDVALRLDSDGNLLVVSDQPARVMLSRFGLGRVAILPKLENLSVSLNRQARGQVVAFLWKVRRDKAVRNGLLWHASSAQQSLAVQLESLGMNPEIDETGVFLSAPEEQNRLKRIGGTMSQRATMINGRLYVKPEMNATFSEHLGPKTHPCLATTEQLLLPENIQMVPTWIFGVILTAYVLTIGPVDYFLLGWLRMRKYTWLFFPAVTFLYTGITVWIAWAYMASDQTGGKLVITDVGVNGVPLRQTTLETFYFGASTSTTVAMKKAVVVQGEQIRMGADFEWGPEAGKNRVSAHAPLSYDGAFPQSYNVTQAVEQWSPLTLRTLTLEPESVNVPAIDWNDETLITTETGRQRLSSIIAKLPEYENPGTVTMALALHQNAVHWIDPGNNRRLPSSTNVDEEAVMTRASKISQLASVLPTSFMNSSGSQYQFRGQQYFRDQSPGYFNVVSQISPEGSTTLEDLAFLDSSDTSQWALVILHHDGETIRVFRKLYVVDP